VSKYKAVTYEYFIAGEDANRYIKLADSLSAATTPLSVADQQKLGDVLRVVNRRISANDCIPITHPLRQRAYARAVGRVEAKRKRNRYVAENKRSRLRVPNIKLDLPPRIVRGIGADAKYAIAWRADNSIGIRGMSYKDIAQKYTARLLAQYDIDHPISVTVVRDIGLGTTRKAAFAKHDNGMWIHNTWKGKPDI
jgi:hypothetical protein